MTKFKMALSSFLLTLLVSFSTSSSAITASEFLEDNNPKEVAAYLSGLADMMAYSRIAEGYEDAGNCIYEWFYRTEGTAEKIYGYFEEYPISAPEVIFLMLGRSACPIFEGKDGGKAKFHLNFLDHLKAF